MKKVWFQIGIALLCFNLVHAERVLRISAPPSIWVQKQGNTLAGPLIELLEKIFSEFDVRLESQVLPWARAISHIKSGKLDMIPVIFYTAERAEYMDFTIPYIDVPTAVFVPAGKSFPFAKPDDLKGKSGLKMRGDSISPEFEAVKGHLKLTLLAHYEQMLKMLAHKRADYAVAAQYGFLIEAKKLGYDQRIEILPVPIASRSLHFAFSKRSSLLKYLPAVNHQIEQMRTDGTIQKMVQKAVQKAAGPSS